LKESEQRFRLLLDSVREGIWTTDTEGVVTFVNPYLCTLLGYSSEDVVGKSLFDFIDVSSIETAKNQYLRETLNYNEPFESKLARKDGTKTAAEIHFNALPDDTGKTSGFITTVKDISEKKRADDTYRLLVETSVQGFAILQRGRIVFCNNALASLSGYSCDELRSMKLEDIVGIVHPDDKPYMRSILTASLAGKTPEPDQKFRFIDKGNRARWVETTTVRTDYHGASALLITYMKATQRHEAELAHRESEERFRTFIEDAPVAIGVSRAGKTLYVNTAYLQMFGIPNLEDVVGQSIMDQIAPESRKEVSERLLKKTHHEHTVAEFEITAAPQNGLPFFCRVAVTLLILSDGPAMLAFYFDLTAQKNSEKKLENSQGRLRNLAVHLLHAREEERKTVAREIHDELGQILTALKMDLQWIEKRSDPRMTQIMEKIHGVVALADQTIQMVHRISSELRPGILDDLGLAAAIEWLGGDFSRRNGIPCRVDITAPEAMIVGKHATDLFRIVQETLINVAHHAHASQVSVELWEENRILTIRVQDDGLGITEEQATSPSAFGLIGIRERVQGLRGEISILGRPGKGTALMATIPLPLEGARI